MSCDTTGKKVATKAGQTAGISATGSKFNHVAGTITDKALLAGYHVLTRAAVVSDAVLDTVDRRGLVARLARAKTVKAIVAGAALEEMGRRKATKGGADAEVMDQTPPGTFAAIGAGQVLPAAAAATAIHQVSTHLGSLASRATRQEEVGLVTQKRPVSLAGFSLGEADERVSLWRSSLTRTLNALDAPVPGQTRSFRHSDGILFKTGDTTWHRGTMIVETPKGERMLTHLQSLNLPAAHYYFDCALSDEQAVGIAAGRIHPESLPGYVGQVSPLESLTIAWGGAKHAMIKNVVYFRDPEKPKSIEKSKPRE
jgi:hypothetical protein